MDQGVQAGAGGQIGVHGRQGEGINQGDIGDDCFADNGDFILFLNISDNGKLRDIRGSTRGGGNANQRRHGHGYLIDALELQDMLSIGADDADAFGAVYGAAATHRQYEVAPGAFIYFRAPHHFFGPGIGAHPVEDDISQVFKFQIFYYSISPTRRPDPRIGDDQDAGGAEVFGITPGKLQGAYAKNKLRSDKFP